MAIRSARGNSNGTWASTDEGRGDGETLMPGGREGTRFSKSSPSPRASRFPHPLAPHWLNREQHFSEARERPARVVDLQLKRVARLANGRHRIGAVGGKECRRLWRIVVHVLRLLDGLAERCE